MNESFAARLHRLGDAIAELAQAGRIAHVQAQSADEKTFFTLSGYSANQISALMTQDGPTGPQFFSRYFPPDNQLGAELAMMYRMHFGEMAE